MPGATQATSKLLETGALGAVLLLVFAFIFFFAFKFYLPQQTKVQLEKARLEAENQANKDRYSQAMNQQFMDMLKEAQDRHASEMRMIREEHSKSWEIQRDFYQQRAEADRTHYERVIDRVCDGLESLERVTERNSMMIIALAEGQGRSKLDLLERVETLTGESDLKEQYKTRGDWEDPSGSAVRKRVMGHDKEKDTPGRYRSSGNS